MNKHVKKVNMYIKKLEKTLGNMKEESTTTRGIQSDITDEISRLREQLNTLRASESNYRRMYKKQYKINLRLILWSSAATIALVVSSITWIMQ